MGLEETKLIYENVKCVHQQVIERINFLDNKATTILSILFVVLGLVLKVGYDLIASLDVLIPQKTVSYILSIVLFLLFFFSILTLLKSLKLALEAFECGRISLDPHPKLLVDEYQNEDKSKILSDIAISMADAAFENRKEAVKKSMCLDDAMRNIYRGAFMLVIFTIILILYLLVN